MNNSMLPRTLSGSVAGVRKGESPMNSDKMIHSVLYSAVAIAAILGCLFACANSAEATYSEDYGQVYNIDLSSGYMYQYTPTFQPGLSDYVTVSIEKYEQAGLVASVSGKTLMVEQSTTAVPGTSYDLILKAVTDVGGIQQTKYQHLRFNIASNFDLTYSGVADIVLGNSISSTPTVVGTEMQKDGTALTFTKGSGFPAELTLNATTGAISGTPSSIGSKTLPVTVTMTNKANQTVTDTYTVTFRVWSPVASGTSESIYSNGNNVSSTAVTQPSDLSVTWTVQTGTMPSGFSLNASTGVISGSSTQCQKTNIELKVTTNNGSGPTQTGTKTVTIGSESPISLATAGNVTTLATYPGKSSMTLQMNVAANTSTMTYSIPATTGVSINSSTGVLTVTSAASSGTVTVTVTSANGGTDTKVITIVKESTLVLAGSDTLAKMASGTSNKQTYSTNVLAGDWSVDTSNVPQGVTVVVNEDGSLELATADLTIDGSTVSNFTVTLSFTSQGGQSTSKTVTCIVINDSIITNDPTSGTYIFSA